MAIRMPRITHAKQVLRQSSAATTDVPKGHLAVYVGESEKKRFVIPISYLNNPSFQDLLSQAEEDLGLIIQWVVLLFHAEKTPSLISLLDWVDHDSLIERTLVSIF